MKPQMFKIGQEVTLKFPIRKYRIMCGGEPHRLPVFGKIYTVVGYNEGVADNAWYLSLSGLPHQWDESAFAPIVADSILAEELSSIPQLETV